MLVCGPLIPSACVILKGDSGVLHMFNIFDQHLSVSQDLVKSCCQLSPLHVCG